MYKKDDPYIRALDYGCGIGSNSILMEEFVLRFSYRYIKDRYNATRELASLAGLNDLTKRINLTKGTGLNFRDNEFDFVLCDSVLDSMHFELAKTIFNEFAELQKNISL